MKTAIFSDIHGNATALMAVLDDLDAFKPELIISLGDNIGYGPEPEKVVSLLRHRNIPSVIGNHELAINRPDFLKWFNPTARTSLEKTREMISPATIAYISKLGYCMVLGNCRFVHGFPPGSPTVYLFEVTPQKLKNTLERMNEWICFVGHTHLLEMVSFDGNEVRREFLRGGEFYLNPDEKYIINAGSVGQPRDGDNKAKYLIWDAAASKIIVRCVPYNVDETVRKIYQAGLPEQHAWRLM
jgi:diadenosine tetraphosphatase ApaH/serine/threonine PP2A family protein phosphatase